MPHVREPRRLCAAPSAAVAATLGLLTLGCLCGPYTGDECDPHGAYLERAEDTAVVEGDDGSTDFLLDAHHAVILKGTVDATVAVASPEDDSFREPTTADMRLQLTGDWTSEEGGVLALYAVSPDWYMGCEIPESAIQVSHQVIVEAGEGVDIPQTTTTILFNVDVDADFRLLLGVTGDAALHGNGIELRAEISAESQCPIEGGIALVVTGERIVQGCADGSGADTGPTDTGPTDTGPADTGPTDTAGEDTSAPDTASADTGAPR